jgi:heterotetrameric sarcosine oxidase gamma subunit
LAKGCTLNLSPAAFTDGDCAQTGISRTSVLLANTNDVINIIVRRSFAEYLALWLQHAGAELGIRFE